MTIKALSSGSTASDVAVGNIDDSQCRQSLRVLLYKMICHGVAEYLCYKQVKWGFQIRTSMLYKAQGQYFVFRLFIAEPVCRRIERDRTPYPPFLVGFHTAKAFRDVIPHLPY